MKVILQKDVSNLGKIGDIVRVKNGYGRNYLIPRGLAVIADERNQRVLDHQKRIAQSLATKQRAMVQELADKLQDTTLSFKRESSEDGKLFGSVTKRDIAEELKKYAKTDNIAVVVKAEHHCMTHRGVREHESDMTTAIMLGHFKEDSATRDEFYKICMSMKGHE